MKIIEFILGIIIFTLITINLLLFPKFQVLLILTLGLASNFYFILSFAIFNNIRFNKLFASQSFKGINQLKLIGSILTGFAISLVLIGLLFKLQAYPLQNFILGFGLLGMIISFIVSIIKIRANKSEFYIRNIIRLFFYGGIGLFFLVFPKENMLEFKYRNYPTYIEAVKKAQADPNNRELWKKAEEERQKIFDK